MKPFRLREHGSSLVYRIETGADLVNLSTSHHREAFGGDPTEAAVPTLAMVVGNLIEQLSREKQMEVCELWGFEELEAE